MGKGGASQIKNLHRKRSIFNRLEQFFKRFITPWSRREDGELYRKDFLCDSRHPAICFVCIAIRSFFRYPHFFRPSLTRWTVNMKQGVWIYNGAAAEHFIELWFVPHDSSQAVALSKIPRTDIRAMLRAKLSKSASSDEPNVKSTETPITSLLAMLSQRTTQME